MDDPGFGHRPLSGKKALIIVAAVLILIPLLASKLENGTSSPTGEQSPMHNTRLSVGDTGILNNNSNPIDCSGIVVLALNKEALDRLTNASAAGDQYGYEEVIDTGNAIILPNCTSVRGVDLTVSATQVRVLEGDHEGVAGWVPFEFAIKR